jgi:hypothetical protein
MVWQQVVSLSAKGRKPLFFGYMDTSMCKELRTRALYLKELKLRERFDGILD